MTMHDGLTSGRIGDETASAGMSPAGTKGPAMFRTPRKNSEEDLLLHREDPTEVLNQFDRIQACRKTIQPTHSHRHASLLLIPSDPLTLLFADDDTDRPRTPLQRATLAQGFSCGRIQIQGSRLCCLRRCSAFCGTLRRRMILRQSRSSRSSPLS
jgi:hypothetical protein